MPHVTKIERKPKGVRTELKDAACAQTKAVIALEIREGKEAMALKDYASEYTKAGTATVLRLTKPWHGSGCVINGDSAFASVTTAVIKACSSLDLSKLLQRCSLSSTFTFSPVNMATMVIGKH